MTTPMLFPEIWDDDDFSELSADEKVAWFWLLTNGSVTSAGWLPFSRRKWSNQTGMPVETVDSMLAKMSHSVLRHGNMIWIRKWMFYQWKPGTRTSPKFNKHLVESVLMMPPPLQKAAWEDYLELQPGMRAASPFWATYGDENGSVSKCVDTHPTQNDTPSKCVDTPSKCVDTHPTQNDTPSTQNDTHSPQNRPPSFCKVSTGQVRYSEEGEVQKGEEVGGSVEVAVPSEEDVLEFGRSWPGEPSSGIPPGIPDPWLLDLLTWMFNDPRKIPRDWRRWILRRFRRDWVDRDARAHRKPTGSKSAASQVYVLERKAQALDRLIENHPANEESASSSSDPSKEQIEHLRTLRRQRSALTTQIAEIQ